MKRSKIIMRATALLSALAFAGMAVAQEDTNPEAKNMRLVGYSDLQERTAYQPIIHEQGERWIAYVGHHGDKKIDPLTGQAEHNGTSIIDVTDPKQPKYLFHITGEEGLAEQGGGADGAPVQRCGAAQGRQE